MIECLVRVEESTKSAHHRINGMEAMQKEIHALALSVSELAGAVKNYCEDVNSINSRVKSLEEKPAKRYDQVVGYILAAMTSGLVGFLLSKII